ncbi:molybdopterin-guanine dinucleotide biosynthesis protein B [Parasporobacterium paucivorans]|uniref:Molybdopterin molybdenumtransferase n=1 Tax=Parasporobacterium paucivorans DSM 15970 TaxID=1122934 RepID=A0A1M6E640_9FIRM|nr:gephyrin-like molybdotransferase Glp [Parasporobacterium paucivorans]SHI80967.1 molybdopterin-guanine dinucleotide biosynthesis protein MobB [Parasporobacterium paucivorans DSM 15970]
MAFHTPVVSFVGYSGSGKTTFIEKLIPELKRKNLRIAVIKHDAHEFDIDREGKDTWKFAQAGADIISISSRTKMALIEKTPVELTLAEIMLNVRDVDLIIAEGYRAGGAPKIGVYREASGHELSVPVQELEALVCDRKITDEIPCFGLDDVSGMADFLVEHFVRRIPFGIPLGEALKKLEDIPVELTYEEVGIDKSRGRVLAETVIAKEMIPPFSRSPLDGYAFRASDTENASRKAPVTLQITEEIPAGTYPQKEVLPGTAAKILTGAPIPKGADAVTRYEDTEFDSDTVTLFQCYKPHSNIVDAGEDIALGTEVVTEGTVITPSIAGLLASLGVARPRVVRKPVISIVNTGDELLDVNMPLEPAKIRNSSHYTLGGYMEETGVTVLDGGIARDTAQEIARSIRTALAFSDMVVTTGGVSVGDYDLVKDALKLLGAETLFWKIAIKPGGAVVAAVLDKKLILGLSGNPASALVTLQLLGIPFIHRLMGRSECGLRKVQVAMCRNYMKPSPTGRYIRGRLTIEEGKACFEPIESQENGSISSMKGCNLIAEIKPGTLTIEKNQMIDAYWLYS